MKNKIYIIFIALLGLFVSCEKDEVQVVMLDNPTAPTIVALPNLTLERNNGTDTLEFVGTNVDPGFVASANYFLEAAAAGTNFADKLVVATSVQGTSFKITVSDLNGLLLKKFEADEATSVDFRLRSQLIVDAGTGAPGTSSNPFEYISEVKTANVTTYGLPRLNLLNSGIEQKIESALGNGVYKGYVKLSKDNPFTLQNPDTDKVYGGSGGVLTEGGSAIAASNSGWHMLEANTNAMTFSTTEYFIGLVGSATPNGWDTPDQKMDYDAKTGTWNITIDLAAGEVKFRLNDGWAWNLGGPLNKLTQGGDNIPVTAGNWTISLAINADNTGSATFVKN